MSDEQNVPKWGDPIESIPEERRTELLGLHEEQVRWLRDTGPDRNHTQSPIARACSENGGPLTGAEVYFLAAEALATDQRIELAQAEWRLTKGYAVPSLHLEGASLYAAHLEGACLVHAHLEDVNLTLARLEKANLGSIHLNRAYLLAAHLDHAHLAGAHLESVSLENAHLGGANLINASLEGADLRQARLEGADLRGAYFSISTTLERATVIDQKRDAVRVADVRWQGVNLAVVEWPRGMLLGDEKVAHQFLNESLLKGPSSAERQKAKAERDAHLFYAWRNSTRAYRQLSTAMRDQGMNDEADRFAYRGNVCQRQLYRVQGQHLRRFGSWLLDLISGYGYKPLRSVIAYVLIIGFFAGLYLLNAQFAAPHLSWDEALVLSTSSFHGRGFFTSGISLSDTLARLAAGEAIVGLLIEITFIATFTQRFFAR